MKTTIGSQLSHYTLLEEIRRGDFEIVYRARDDKLNREVCLKVLPPELVAEPERKKRFVQEAKAAAALENPHIAVIHEIDEADGNIFIAMELLRGDSLAARMEKGPLPVAEALETAEAIASGLAYAHDNGVVHRDLKPSNVMLTSQGHPKLIDFGLAKLLDMEKNPFLGRGDQEPALRAPTREGYLAGTVSYMSPEQARGGRVDHESDVFSFGLLLYHMLSGTPPFRGASRIDTLHAILNEPTPKLSGSSNISVEERSRLQRIIDRCLQKNPDDRYASMSDVAADLHEARLRLRARATFLGIDRRFWLAAVAVVAVALGAIADSVLDRRAPVASPPSKPSLAVLHFDNLSGDPELEWLRTGLTDMLVTDLSQSTEIEVLATNRLYQILEDMDRLQTSPMPSDAISELARRANATTVVLGSFAKVGDEIRLSARLQEADSGRVLYSDKAEGTGEESIFRLVDEITSGIKESLSLTTPSDELDRDLRDVTTSSVEAYRHYAEGIRLHERFREEESIPHFQRAVELDPGFAMALAKLGVVHGNLGRTEEADDYAEQAFEHVGRLSERERHYIEGWYYSRNPETFDRALDSYRTALELYPDHGSARHNLGLLLYSTERYEEAIEVLEELRRRRMLFPATYEHLASSYAALGDVDEAVNVLREYGARNPDDWTTVVSLAKLQIASGDIDEGLSTLERADALGASELRTAPVYWEAHIFERRWEEALATARALTASDEPLAKVFGDRLSATTLLYRGQSRSILDGFDRPPDVQGPLRTEVLLFQTQLLLELGEYKKARETAHSLRGLEDKATLMRGSRALVMESLAARRMGDREDARELAEQYRDQLNPNLGPGPERLMQFLEGELALADGDYVAALSFLNEAESRLSPRGVESTHTVIWYALATAHREAGNDGEAIDWYQRITQSTHERLYEPIPYVRSFFFLARLLEARGDARRAEENYQNFYELWSDGDIDREHVAEAAAKLD